MKNQHSFILCLLALIFSHTSLADEVPSVSRSDKDIVVNLPANFLKAISKDYPSLRVPKFKDLKGEWSNPYFGQHPFLCWGDFNGDRLTDIAVILVSDSGGWALAIYHQLKDGSYRHVFPDAIGSIAKGDEPSNHGISTHSKRVPWEYRMSTGGVGYEMDRTDSYKFENDIVDFVTYELSESAMYWDGNKYQDISYGE